jgi:hypothetical protein
VVHNIPKSITKLIPADVSLQEPRTLQSLPPPLNWKHKKITQAHRYEVNAGLFQFCTTTVHPTCSDDWTHVVWSMDGCDHAPYGHVMVLLSPQSPLYSHILPAVTDWLTIVSEHVIPTMCHPADYDWLRLQFSLSITVHTPGTRSGKLKKGLIRCVHDSWH